MGKWLGALGVLVLVVLFLLWRQLDSSSATAAPKLDAPARAPEVAAAAGTPAKSGEQPAAKPTETVAAAAPTEKPADNGKWDPQSDEFFHKHDEIVIPQLMRSAVKCWENLPATKRTEFHRNQSMVAKFKQRIRDGVVTIYDVEVERSSISDAALEACFIQQIRGTTWTNAKLPDWDQEDQIKLGPRTLKKYTRENIDYVGAEAPPQ